MSYFTETFSFILEKMDKDILKKTHRNGLRGAGLSMLYGPTGGLMAAKYPAELIYTSVDKKVYHGVAAKDKWISDQLNNKEYIYFYRYNVADSIEHQKKVRDYFKAKGRKGYIKEADAIIVNMISHKDYNLNAHKISWFDINELKKALRS